MTFSSLTVNDLVKRSIYIYSKYWPRGNCWLSWCDRGKLLMPIALDTMSLEIVAQACHGYFKHQVLHIYMRVLFFWHPRRLVQFEIISRGEPATHPENEYWYWMMTLKVTMSHETSMRYLSWSCSMIDTIMPHIIRMRTLTIFLKFSCQVHLTPTSKYQSATKCNSLRCNLLDAFTLFSSRRLDSNCSACERTRALLPTPWMNRTCINSTVSRASKENNSLLHEQPTRVKRLDVSVVIIYDIYRRHQESNIKTGNHIIPHDGKCKTLGCTRNISRLIRQRWPREDTRQFNLHLFRLS